MWQLPTSSMEEYGRLTQKMDWPYTLPLSGQENPEARSGGKWGILIINQNPSVLSQANTPGRELCHIQGRYTDIRDLFRNVHVRQISEVSQYCIYAFLMRSFCLPCRKIQRCIHMKQIFKNSKYFMLHVFKHSVYSYIGVCFPLSKLKTYTRNIQPKTALI